MKKPSFFPVLVGTGFGSGFSPFAPGTAGALLATLIWIIFYCFGSMSDMADGGFYPFFYDTGNMGCQSS